MELSLGVHELECVANGHRTDVTRPDIELFLSCYTSDRFPYEMTGNYKGSCHLTEIETLPIQTVTLHDLFLAIVISCVNTQSHIYCYDGLRSTPISRIVTDGIAEDFTLHDVVRTSASWRNRRASQDQNHVMRYLSKSLIDARLFKCIYSMSNKL